MVARSLLAALAAMALREGAGEASQSLRGRQLPDESAKAPPPAAVAKLAGEVVPEGAAVPSTGTGGPDAAIGQVAPEESPEKAAIAETTAEGDAGRAGDAAARTVGEQGSKIGAVEQEGSGDGAAKTFGEAEATVGEVSQEGADPARTAAQQAASNSTLGASALNAGYSGGYRMCLCLFDVDRTITGKQDITSPACPGNYVKHGVWDNAYGEGDLTLSNLGQHMHTTACGGCALGVVSHGTAGGGSMKGWIHDTLNSITGEIPNHWSYAGDIQSPLVIGCGYKPTCARAVMDWYNRHGCAISASNVYMFDDKGSNVRDFYGSGMNAKEVSCDSRDWGRQGSVGLCGARASEIQLSRGVHEC